MTSPDDTGNRHSRTVQGVGVVLLLLVGGFALTPYGGWVQSFFHGTGTRWQDAYIALEAAETNLPRDPRERERLLLALAQTEGEPPIGMTIGPRLHRPGTLARLHYETFDENGERIDEWDVRALVPNIGNGNGPFWREPCAKACQDEVASGSGIRMRRSGEAGIAEEYVLRMPVGQAFPLRPSPLVTQDILDERPRRVPQGLVRVGEKSVPRPAKIVVTLAEACPASVRVGTAMNFEFDENATIPVPKGFRTSHWAQLDGCGKLLPFAPPPEEPRVVAKPSIGEPPDLHAVALRREPRTGYAALKVDEPWLRAHDTPVLFQVTRICRYDAVTDLWQPLVPPDPRRSWRLEPLSPAEAAEGDRVAFELPQETALFEVRWVEYHDDLPASRNLAYRDALVTSGPVPCNDIAMGPAPEGRISACVPFADRAEARFVPEPEKPCGGLAVWTPVK
jgi:hypothetical protein